MSHATPYRRPRLLLLYGALMPLVLGIILAFAGYRPQCPDSYTQTQVDSGNCIVGADMSAVSILFALPIVFISLVSAAIWVLLIWYRKRKA